MMHKLLWAVLLCSCLSAGCVGSDTTRCGTDICAAGQACDPIHDQCVLPIQLVICDGRPNGEPCEFGAGNVFHCHQGVCIPGLCGDGVVDVGERCDDAEQNSDSLADACRTTCDPASCGDGVIDTGEVCDDDNALGGDGCSADCISDESCGNGVRDIAAGEGCDDGNNVAGDGCSAECLLESCGNGAVDDGEACDDGNNDDGDGCSANCISDETCGNGVIDTINGEGCDGNNVSGDDCSADCHLESCGNNAVDPGETCDDGNNVAGDGCSADCLSDESCGNGYIDLIPGETCDDGNNVAGDGCSANCDSDETCGNGIVDTAVGESCEDGNLVSGDGCSDTCQFEVTCTEDAIISCGDWVSDSSDGTNDIEFLSCAPTLGTRSERIYRFERPTSGPVVITHSDSSNCDAYVIEGACNPELCLDHRIDDSNLTFQAVGGTTYFIVMETDSIFLGCSPSLHVTCN